MALFKTPEYTLIGSKALEEAKPYLKKCGKKALIVTGKHVVLSDMMAELKKALEEIGIAYFVFDGITGEPTNVMIDEGIAAYKENGCDFCIGIGGGSPLDSAKAIAAMITNEGKIADYNGKVIEKPIPPVVAIPTTAGTGSEATQFTVITDVEKDIKMLLKGGYLVPKIAIVDPAYTYSAPKSITAATGMDALTHAIEAYTSRKALPVTDTLAVSAVKRIMKYLPAAYKDGSDEKARYEMSVASYEAGICINNSTVTLVHGMSRPIGALFHVAHGISNAMLLTKCLAFALDGAYEKFANLGREIGAATAEDDDKTASEKFIEALNEICKICEIPTLLEYGIPKDEFFAHMEKMAHDALTSGSPGNTMKPISEQDIIEIYKKLWE
ncbi:MAG TPA: alcohol dehydrogenase [Lachnospiraceae bacterium]|jgi:1,3-propanediol dehydrogenase|nr:alcohol dehydrogenase [Lachnospiraceae bacterium]